MRYSINNSIYTIVCFFLSTIFINNLLYAQSGNLKGKITDLNGNPLAGANVVLMNTTYGTSSDSSGNFKLERIDEGTYTIVITMIGYERTVLEDEDISRTTPFLRIKLKETSILSQQVVVSASKHEQKVFDLPVSAAVVNSSELANKNFVTIDQAMRYAPGVSVTQGQVSIRGSSGYSNGVGTRVYVAFDGIPISSGDTGEITWEMIPISEIDRIEIIKGAASSLYGSNAIGGVINIIPKKISNVPMTYFKAYFGGYDKPSYSQWDWSKSFRKFDGQTLTHSNRFNKLGFTVSLSRLEDQSYRQSDFFKRYIGYLRASYDFDEFSSLSLFANYLNQNTGEFIYWKDAAHALQPPDADIGQSVRTYRYMVALNFRHLFTNNFFLNFKTNFNRAKWIDNTSSNDTSATNFIRNELQMNFNLSKNLFLVSGVETINSKVNSNMFGNPKAFTLGFYSQVDYKFDFPLTLTAGIRYDYSKLDSMKEMHSGSPKFGLNYSLSGNTAIRASVGRGFRAPSLAEAFVKSYVSGIQLYPNPHLKSETNLSAETGIYHSFSRFLDIDLAVFQNEYYNFIEPTLNLTSLIVQFSNITRARIQGIEINSDINIIPEKLMFNINYVYLWARDLTLNSPLKYRPRNTVYLKTDYYLGNFQFGADFRYWSRVEAIDVELAQFGIIPDGNKRVPVYVLDLRTGYNLLSLGFPGKVYLNINNALNYNYVEIIGNLSPIRNVSLSTEILF